MKTLHFHVDIVYRTSLNALPQRVHASSSASVEDYHLGALDLLDNLSARILLLLPDAEAIDRVSVRIEPFPPRPETASAGVPS